MNHLYRIFDCNALVSTATSDDSMKGSYDHSHYILEAAAAAAPPLAIKVEKGYAYTSGDTRSEMDRCLPSPPRTANKKLCFFYK